MNHTPGPWHVQVRKTGWDIHEPIAEGGFRIAHVNTEANARLIAAAPELLDALRGLVGDIRNGGPRHAAMALAEATLAKAGG